MDHYQVHIADEAVNAALHESARVHGRSVEEEISAIVMRNAQVRALAPDYTPGYEPLPGESFVDHITRISRPGFDLDLPERELFELRDPFDDAG